MKTFTLTFILAFFAFSCNSIIEKKSAVTNLIESKTISIIASSLSVTPDVITSDADLKEDLGADSMKFVEIVIQLENEFEITLNKEQIEKVENVEDLVEVVRNNITKS